MSLIPYDARDGYIWIDGALKPWREANVHFLTHTLHYGGGIFEGMRAYDGGIFKLQEHNARMLEGCAAIGLPMHYSLEEMNRACLEALKANNLQNCYIRSLAWRGSEQMGIGATQCKTHFAVAVWEWGRYFSDEMRQKGIKLHLSRWRRPAPDNAPVHAKAVGLYLICTMSKHEAEKAGYEDALMLDYRGQVAELTGANFFMITKNGEIHTPLPDCFLNGITRLTVIDLARKHGFKVVERAIFPEDLSDAVECFATGTAFEIMPIQCIGNKNFAIGPITKSLMEKFFQIVRAPQTVALSETG